MFDIKYRHEGLISKMEDFWKKAVSVTGPVAVVAFLLALIIEAVFRDKVIEIFGADKFFYIVVALVAVLFCALILAIIRNRPLSSEGMISSKGDIRRVAIRDSRIAGDIVLGDKNITDGAKSD